MGTQLSSHLFPLRAVFHSCFLSFLVFGVLASPRFFFTWYHLCSSWAASCHWQIVCGQCSWFMQACARPKGSPSLKRGTNCYKLFSLYCTIRLMIQPAPKR